MSRESMEFDVVIVGAGPAGLSTAIKLAQLTRVTKKTCSICVLEKASKVGGHILSGNVLDPKGLDELIPNWREKNAPVTCAVTQDRFVLLTEKSGLRLPTPPQMHNRGNYIISLGLVCQWLAEQAEELGIAIFPGFSATQMIYKNNHVIGVATGDMGVKKDHQPSDRFLPGVNILAKQVVLAEGCHGSLSQEIISKYHLRKGKSPQTYALGIKELWEIPSAQHQEGLVMHTVGWPLDHFTYGGSFMYHAEHNKIATGFVVGLDYKNPYLDPFQEFQRFKMHPKIRPFLAFGKRLAYGARALVEGGIQSLPKLTFPGGMIVGDSAGTLNVPKIKGTHTAIKSGILAAEAIFESLEDLAGKELSRYQEFFDSSSVYKELHRERNIRPGFKLGLFAGILNAGLETYLFRGKAPWTLKHKPDHHSLIPANKAKKIIYPKPDGIVSFDKLSSVYLANLQYQEDQPCHLQLKHPSVAITVNHAIYDSPETRYCPANVYEFVDTDNKPRLQINAGNCVQCKTCDIKDPKQNIHWVPPEGGSGPNYGEM